MPSNRVTAKTPWHLVFILDDSGSMSGDPIQSLNETMKEIVDEMEVATMGGKKAYFRISVIQYGDKPNIICENATESTIDVDSVFNFTGDSGLTDMALALKEAKEILIRNPGEKTDFRPYVFLLSDGIPTGEDPTYVAEELKKVDIAAGSPKLVTIGIGDDVNSDLMKELASNSEFYKQIESPKDLIQIFFPAIGTATSTNTSEDDVEETIINA